MTEIYEAISVIEEANQSFRRTYWLDRYWRPHPNEIIFGQVQQIGFAPPAILLMIDGLVIECSHAQLRQALLSLRPQPGETVTIINFGGSRGYSYMVVVNRGEENERAWGEENGREWEQGDGAELRLVLGGPEGEAESLRWLGDDWIEVPSEDEDLDLGWLRDEIDAERREGRR